MKHHYLIDYENVHEDGLTGLNTIEDDAVIHIFYSDRARKLDLDSFREGQILQIEALKVPVGKQSLDMQLVSYMGYLMGREKGEGNCYVIVSKDNGYLNSIPFWKQIMRDGTTVEVRPQIRPKQVEEVKSEAVAPKTESPRVKSQKVKAQKAVLQKAEKQNTEVQKAEVQKIEVQKTEILKTDDRKAESSKPEVQKHAFEQNAPSNPRQEKNERRSRSRGRGRNRRERNQEMNQVIAEAPVVVEETPVVVVEEAPVETEVPVAVVEEAPAKTEVPVIAETVAEYKAEPEEAPSVNVEVTETVVEEAKEASAEVTEAPVVDTKEAPADAAETPAVDTKEAPVKKPSSRRNRSKQNSGSAKPLDRSTLNTTVMQTLSKGNIDAATTGKISSIVMKYASEERNKTMIYREIIKTLGQKDGLQAYNLIKNLL